MGQLAAIILTVSILLHAFFVHAADTGYSQAKSPSFHNLPVYDYEIIESYNHNPDFFTQGLAFDKGILYEGTGKYGQSRLVSMYPDGSEKKIRKLPSHFFGEGITVLGNDIVQLTWKAKTGIVWDKKTLEIKKKFSYPRDGWGITHDDRWLIMSDGSSSLYFLNPRTFLFHHKLEVSAAGVPVKFLNELEYIKGEIWANIWKDDRIIRIDPQSGKVTSWVDLSKLVETAAPGQADYVLNGIAYDKENDRIFVTGKCWDRFFEIKVRLTK